MQRVAIELEAWRCALRRRGTLPAGSPERQAANEEARRAQAAYRAELAQATAYHAELDFAPPDRLYERWLGRIDSVAADILGRASPTQRGAPEQRGVRRGERSAFEAEPDL